MPEKTTNERKHAVVIGASMAGLFAARILSDHFERVTIIERDPVNDFPESRKGQAQTRHIHGLLAQGLTIINKYFPGIEQELAEGGAVVADMGQMLHWYQYGDYRKQFKSGLRSITLSRPYLELHIRRRVMGLHNVQLSSPCAVRELVTNADKAQVIGAYVEKRHNEDQAERLMADLIVDASGRGSSTPKWLASFGYESPREEEVRIRVGYATRIYKRKPNPAAILQVHMISPTAPEGKRGAFIFPIEEDRWIVTAGGASGHYPPDNEADFLEFMRTLPTSDIFDILSRTEPLTDIITYRYPLSVRRHYEELKRFPDGYLVIGDAVASFNPIYGQGMTSAAMQAEILDQTLKQQQGIRDLWPSFFKRVAKVVDIPWQLAVGEDFRYPETEGKKPPFTDLLNAYIAKVHKATHHDTVVYSQFLRVINLMAPPLSLMSPGIFWRVMKNGKGIRAEKVRCSIRIESPQWKLLHDACEAGNKMMNNKSQKEWLEIHNRAAWDYINSEWSREVPMGVGKKRRNLFSQATGHVLDVGCGYGMNFPYLTNATDITGIDFSRVMLQKARDSIQRSGLVVDLREGNAEALEFADNAFDTVISALSTCSFYDPIQALQEMRRVCKPDGKILLVEHGRSSWNWLGRYQDKHVQQQIEQGGCRWNQEPQELVQQAGIKIIRADRSLLGIFHTITASPAKEN